MQEIKKVLITGGAGFIGSYVADELLRAGFGVKILDNLDPLVHGEALPEWIDKRAEFIAGDVSKKEDWQSALADIDAVIHLAAYMDYHLDFSRYVRNNIESLALLCEIIMEKKLPIKKIIIASSQSVYGGSKYTCPNHGTIYPPPRSQEQLAAHEWEMKCPECRSVLTPESQDESDILNPETPYGISKLCSEQFLMNLGRRYNVPSIALRYSIVLGPRQSFRHFYSGALRAFAVNVLCGQPIEMNEDGHQTRDFVDVRDVAKAHLLALTDPRADFNAFNVGSGQMTKIIDLARMAAEAAGVEFRPLLKNTCRIGDSRHSLMRIEKLRGLGWEPQYQLRETIENYIKWIRQFSNLSEKLEETYKKMHEEGIRKTA